MMFLWCDVTGPERGQRRLFELGEHEHVGADGVPELVAAALKAADVTDDDVARDRVVVALLTGRDRTDIPPSLEGATLHTIKR